MRTSAALSSCGRAKAGRSLNLYTPAAMLGYFDELADAIRRGEVDPEVLSAIARRYSMRVLGPVPEGYA